MNELIGTDTVISKTFKGDILITDPCYICKERDESTYPEWNDYMSYETDNLYPDYDGHISKRFLEEREKLTKDRDLWYKQHPDDWETCDYGSHFEVFGIHTYMTHSTLYGDWSCTVYNKDTEKPIGEFCADAGLVSVFLLDEVRAYNPDIDNWVKEHPWCATVIKDFNGTVSFDIWYIQWTLESDIGYHKAGEICKDDCLVVEGKGNINFTSRQTGL